jgi:hypothetical protein
MSGTTGASSHQGKEARCTPATRLDLIEFAI